MAAKCCSLVQVISGIDCFFTGNGKEPVTGLIDELGSPQSSLSSCKNSL